MSRVQTVLGPISPQDLGVTLVHEHMVCDIRTWYIEPKKSADAVAGEMPVVMNILGMLRHDPFANRDNLVLDDEGLQSKELSFFKAQGGGAVVDLTVPGLGRDPLALMRISSAVGLHIVAPTGFYVAKSHPSFVKEKNVDDLSDLMEQELTQGIGDTGVKAGVIGECGCSYPIPYHPEEEKVLKAAAKAQVKTGAPYTIHPVITDWVGKVYPVKCAEAYVDLLEEEEVDLEKFYLSHADRTCIDLDYHRRLLDRGITLSYDNLGKEYYWDSIFVGVGGQSDLQRVRAISELCKQGYDKQLVLSNDVCMKIDLKEYGGYGYVHVLEHVVPMLKAEGVGEAQIRNMLVENPRRLLSF